MHAPCTIHMHRHTISILFSMFLHLYARDSAVCTIVLIPHAILIFFFVISILLLFCWPLIIWSENKNPKLFLLQVFSYVLLIFSWKIIETTNILQRMHAAHQVKPIFIYGLNSEIDFMVFQISSLLNVFIPKINRNSNIFLKNVCINYCNQYKCKKHTYVLQRRIKRSSTWIVIIINGNWNVVGESLVLFVDEKKQRNSFDVESVGFRISNSKHSIKTKNQNNLVAFLPSNSF